MNRKEIILRMVERQADDVSYEQIIHKLVLLRKIEVALDQADRGEVTEHDELFRRLEKQWQEQEPKSNGRKKPKKTSTKSEARLPRTHRSEQVRTRTG